MKQALILAIIFTFGYGKHGSAADSFQHIYLEEFPANPAKGFHWPFLVYTPKKLSKNPYVLILPNNTGKSDDDIEVHYDAALRKTLRIGFEIEKQGWIILRPIFPRPRTNSPGYTHALDRGAIINGKGKMKRLDNQLLQMFHHLQEIRSKKPYNIQNKFLMIGFSASGSFVNRFLLTHPEKVQAAAIGAPGGWMTVPTEKTSNIKLNYPLGIADFEEVFGKPFAIKAFQQPAQLFFMGDQDNNEDSYQESERRVLYQFGTTRMDRWPLNIYLIKSSNCNCSFTLFPGVDHRFDKEMRLKIYKFLHDHS